MYYDPIKDIFAAAIRKYPVLRAAFYKLLDIMFLRSWYVRRELRSLRRIMGDKEISIYDAGTGYGQYSYFMSRKLQPNSIYAVDVKEQWINDCRDFFNRQHINKIEFAVEDLTEIKHLNKFDLIISVDVMEHIVDDVKVFKNFYNALKPGGFLIINTPSIYGGSDVHDDSEESFIGEHAREGYSFDDLKSKLTPLGFSVFRSRYTYGFWGDIAWRLGIKYPMQMLNISKLFFIVLPVYFIAALPFTFLFMYIDYSGANKLGAGVNYIVQK
jgi:2-polyprenyl-3-methyl-5-hydroxy-6-metoxy-1,4-benzoquinol methylase